MKKLFSLVICVMTVLLTSCEKNDPSNQGTSSDSSSVSSSNSYVATGAAEYVTHNFAVLHGEVKVDISEYNEVEYGVLYSTDKSEVESREATKEWSSTLLLDEMYSVSLFYLDGETKYYYCAFVCLNKTQYKFGEVKSFETKENASDRENPSSMYKAKAFSVSSSNQVSFSSGNLQYHLANNEWRFAESQLDYIGYDDPRTDYSYNGWVDLFYYSTSASDFGIWKRREVNDYSEERFVDWGTNQIGNDAPNTWRTLTYDEWSYILRERPNSSSLCGVAHVNGVNGLILLPDNWACPTGITFKSGFQSTFDVYYGDEYYYAKLEHYYAVHQTFTAEQWSKLEAAGAVFLPAAGMLETRDSLIENLQERGYYWSACDNEYIGSWEYCPYFTSNYWDMLYASPLDGQSVRLVKDL